MADNEVNDDDFGGIITFLYAETLDEAQFYKSLLEDHDIPVRIGPKYQGTDLSQSGFPVLVPKDRQDEAEDILEERFMLDDELEEGFNSDVYDDEDELSSFEPLDEHGNFGSVPDIEPLAPDTDKDDSDSDEEFCA